MVAGVGGFINIIKARKRCVRYRVRGRVAEQECCSEANRGKRRFTR